MVLISDYVVLINCYLLFVKAKLENYWPLDIQTLKLYHTHFTTTTGNYDKIS